MPDDIKIELDTPIKENKLEKKEGIFNSNLVIFSEALNEYAGLRIISLSLQDKKQLNIWGLKITAAYFLGETFDGEYISIYMNNGVVWAAKAERFNDLREMKPIARFEEPETTIFDLSKVLQWDLKDIYDV